jgi:Cu(I)/Ag(I) efflux system membrane fusion protein
VQLPDGVVSRMQYSPYRLQLAGVRTAAASYRPLAREVVAVGLVHVPNATAESAAIDVPQAYVEFELTHHDAAMLRPDHAVEISCVARPGQGPWPARVGSVQFDSSPSPLAATVRVEIDDPKRELSPGVEVSARIHLPVADVEPFHSQPTDPEPLSPNEPRSVFVCPEHGDVIGKAGGKCRRDGLALIERPLAENQRLRYWCPMHPHVTAMQPGEKCDQCKGMVLLPRTVTYRPHGEVLAVPESAVIDTGKGHVVYVDRGEGMFEGVEVVVGPRAAGHYAIVRGLEAGEKVVAAGAFLLDAETRLNPNASAAYFGATK